MKGRLAALDARGATLDHRQPRGPRRTPSDDRERGRRTGRAVPANVQHGTAAPLPDLESHAGLPASITSFVGREREIAEVRQLLTTARLVTLIGAPGVGKTRLALQVAAEVSGELAAGARLVRLASLADPALVPRAVASALGIAERPDHPLSETLARAIGRRHLLQVLDNCEHLLAGCASLAITLLERCPGLRVLATSREALRVTGEAVWPVPPLSLPVADDGRPTTDDSHSVVGRPSSVVAEAESVRLFVERARGVLPSFALTDQNARAVAQICHRLDGIPLAIELAAARMAVLAPAQIAERLDDRFQLLTGGSRTALPRHRTLRAAIDWSHDLLAEPERILLRRLSVFAGGWPLEAAEWVTGVGCQVSVDKGGDAPFPDTRHPTPDTLDVLASLVDKSLVVRAEQEGRARYRMLETIRQYGADKLRESGEEALLRDRHLEWFARLAEQAERAFWGPEQAAAFDRLEEEIDNIRAALAWTADAATGARPPAETDGRSGFRAEAALRLAGSLSRFLDIRAYFSEGRAWLDAALAGSSTRSEVRVKALIQSAYIRFVSAEYAAAFPLLEEALAMSCEIGYGFGIALGLVALGAVDLARGRVDQAVPRFEQSLAFSRETGERRGIYLCLHWLAVAVAMPRGELERAAALLDESLRLAREQGDTWTIPYVIFNLGALRLSEGRTEAARDAFLESLDLRRGLKDRWSIAYCVEGLGWVAAAEGRAEPAARLLGAGEALLESMGVARWPLVQPYHERAVADARAALGEDAFAGAWAAGRALSLDEAIDAALAADDGRPTTDDRCSPPSSAVGRRSSVLTRREREVAALVARGLTNREIARELAVAKTTVDRHVANALHKLGLDSRTQLALWAVDRGLRPTPSN